MPRNSPYTLDGAAIPYRIVLVQNGGTPSRQILGQPGVVNYAVNTDGTQFILTVSGFFIFFTFGAIAFGSYSLMGPRREPRKVLLENRNYR